MDPMNFVGIDVSKRKLEVCVRPNNERFEIANDEAGVSALFQRLSSYGGSSMVVFEATGGYERFAATRLQRQGLRVAVVNPQRVRAFARAGGQKAKTDELDANLLSLFAEKMNPEARVLRQEDETLKPLAIRRRQLIEMLGAEKNRLGLVDDEFVRRDLKKHVQLLEKQLVACDEQLRKTIEQNPVWKAKDALLQTAPCVGPNTSTTLLADLPELGLISNKAISALAGLAPFAQDSGHKKGYRAIRGGRASVRTALYMAALSGIRHNPTINAHYKHLRAAGKPGKVALTACAHKLLIWLNAMARSNSPWTPSIPS